MPLPTIDPHRARNAGETLLIAAIGATVFVWIHFPAGLICGSMLAVAVAALAGRPMVVPANLAKLTFFVIGVSLGATVKPETLHGVLDWPVSIALISVSALCMTVGTMSYLRYVHGWDARSALYGGCPGAMAQVISLAVHSGADLRGVVIVQSVRVVFISVSIPAGLALVGLAASPTATLGAASFNASPLEMLLLISFAVLTAMLLHWIKFPASIVFGAMLGSGILHATDVVHAAFPWWFVSGAVVVMGATVGQRFANTPPQMLLAYLGAALGSFAVAAATCASFAVLVAWLTPAKFADLVISFAPGAQDTMMVLALSLHIDPVFVGAHQLARFLTISLSLPVFTQLVTRKDKAAEEGGKKLEEEKGKPPEAAAKKPDDVFPKK